MHEEPRRILCQLIQQYGVDLHADPRRTEALLRDLCHDYPREIFVLVHAQKQAVPIDLCKAPLWMPQQALQAQLVQRLQENLALTPEAATWAVESWVVALNVQPAPPDIAWQWLQQHKPARQTWQPVLHLVHPFTRWMTRLLPSFGVKLIYENLSRRLQPQKWLSRLWLSRLHPAWRNTLILSLCVVLLVGSVNGNISSSQPALSVVDQLEAVYPLPRMAWVSEDQLTIRNGPTTGAAAQGFLPAGQPVTVVKFSPDGQWSQIAGPSAGWVSNHYLLFQDGVTSGVYTMLKVGHAKITIDQVNVRQGPGTTYPIVGTLGQGETISLIATSLDGRWQQIAAPLPGWVSTEFVQVSAAWCAKSQTRVTTVVASLCGQVKERTTIPNF